MDQPLWDAVDRYAADLLIRQDAALEAALRDSDAAGLPSISVTPEHGRMLHIFARMLRARKVLEIGTLGGYSTIWLARRSRPADA